MSEVHSTPTNGGSHAPKSKIWSSHAEILEARGIPASYAEANGLVSFDLEALAKHRERMLKLDKHWKDPFPHLPGYRTTGILIPYQETLDGIPRFRLRSDKTEVTTYPVPGVNHGTNTLTIPRYVCQSKPVKVVAYLPQAVLDVAKDVSATIYITEAPLKALCLSYNGLPAIGMGGVSAGAHDADILQTYEEIVASKELRERILWRGRKVVICFDAGISNNPLVAQGAARVAIALKKEGANVFFVRLPFYHPEDSDPEAGRFWSREDQGPDDFIVRCGIDAFKALVEAVEPMAPAARAKLIVDQMISRADKAQALAALLNDLPFQAMLREEGAIAVDQVGAVTGTLVGKKALKGAAAEFAERLARRTADEQPDWKKELKATEGGTVKPIAFNVEICMRYDSKLAGLIAYDEFRQCVIFRQTPPWTDEYAASRNTKDGDAWSDADDTRLSSYLTRAHSIIDATKHEIQPALNVAARDRAFHPVREYLHALVWDGTPRLDTYAQEYLRANPRLAAYYKIVVPMWYLEAVARVEEPGCQADYVLVLEGEQGDNKTTALKTLGGEWYSDASQDDLQNKEAAMKLHGTWIFVFDEGAVLTRSDARVLKDFVTKTDDDIIPKYSNYKTKFRRQCVFALTTNDHQYLSDPTGNRRFWPIKCGEIDIERIRADRDQLWAEAYARYKDGERRYPSKGEEKAIIEPEQDKRRRPEAWEEAIGDKLVGHREVTVTQILTDFFGRKELDIDQGDRLRVVNALTALGWKQGKPRKVNGVTHRVYVCPGYVETDSEPTPSRTLTRAQEGALTAFTAAIPVVMTLERTASGQVVRVWREAEPKPGDANDTMLEMMDQV
jgi:predicted P-loop ATPase